MLGISRVQGVEMLREGSHDDSEDGNLESRIRLGWEAFVVKNMARINRDGTVGREDVRIERTGLRLTHAEEHDRKHDPNDRDDIL